MKTSRLGHRGGQALRDLRRKPIVLAIVLPVLIYLALSIAGVTTSSIGVSSLREDPSRPSGVQLGEPQEIRSDEYATESPIWLGEIARGGQDAVTPLSVSNDLFAQLPDGPISTVVFFDGSLLALGGAVPDEMLFAAKWWLPSLLLFIGLPLWFRAVAGGMRWGYVASVLIALAPASTWWSARPVNTLGFVAAGCLLAIVGARQLDRRSRRGVLLGVLAMLGAGILLARTPTYYQPLAIVIGVPVVLATAAFLLARPVPWGRRLVGLAAITVSGLVWTSLLFLESMEAVEAGLATVYPGDRQSSGDALPVGNVFGATNLAWLRDTGTALPPITNQSEIASSFTVLLVVLGVLFAARPWRGDRTLSWVVGVMTALACFWVTWATVSWGSIGAAIPLVNRVPSTRAAESVGFVATIAFCLFMTQWRTPRRVAVPATAAAFAGLVSAYGGSSLQDVMPTLTTWMVWSSAAVVAALVFLVAWRPRSRTTIAAVIAGSVLLSSASAPVIVGLADLRSSDAAQRFLSWGAQARDDGTVWATDDGRLDSLLTATATPSLSGRQQIGPDADAWMRLDPGGVHEDLWNRGGLHVRFVWTDEDVVRFDLPSQDVVRITASPCALDERFDELSHIASSTPLEAPCLTLVDEVRWADADFSIYEVATP